jgi:hypothetical protein
LLFIACAGNFKQSVGARNRAGIGLSYWPVRLHRLAGLIPWNRFLSSVKVYKIGLWIWIIDMKNDDHPMAMQEHCSLGSGLADFSLVRLE